MYNILKKDCVVKNLQKLNYNELHDNIMVDDKGGIYIIMAAKQISVRLNDELEDKVEEMRQELEDKFKLQITVTDVIQRAINSMYEEMELEQSFNTKTNNKNLHN